MLLDRMAAELRLPRWHISAVARSASHRYKTYWIPKRSGGRRRIDHPSKALKLLQRWLLRSVLSQLPVHAAAAAYIKDRSIADHARRHRRARYLLRMDFSDFFPSIVAEDFRRYAARNQPRFTGWTVDDHLLFESLVFKDGRLSIGAPSSPTLSNVLCWELDGQLAEIAAGHNAVYSRYADDLFFSTRVRDQLGEVESAVLTAVRDLAIPAGLAINESKTRHTSSKQRQVVTGLILGSAGEISLGRGKKRELSAQLHQWESLSNQQRASLAGWMAFAAGVEPSFVERMRVKYGPPRLDDVTAFRMPNYPEGEPEK